MIHGVFGWLTTAANWTGADGVPNRVAQHMEYSVVALLIAAAIGIPIGLYVGHTGRGTFVVATAANAFRSLPTLGLLILVVLVLLPHLPGNWGFLVPSIVVLVVLGIPPFLTGTYSGIRNTDRAARDAAYGMGMTGRQVLRRVEVPCALPLIMSGARSAMLQIVATATVAAYVGIGGLGRYLIDGEALQDFPQMLSGALLVAVLAILVEVALIGLTRLVVSPGLSGRATRAARRAGRSAGTAPAEQALDAV